VEQKPPVQLQSQTQSAPPASVDGAAAGVSAWATVTPAPQVLQQPSVQLPPVVTQLPVDLGDQQQGVAIPVPAQGQPLLDQGGLPPAPAPLP